MFERLDEDDADQAPPSAAGLGLALILLGGLLLAALVMILVLAPPAHAQAPMTKGQWYKSLRAPGASVDCCDIGDCGLTAASFHDGFWWVPAGLRKDGERWVPDPGRAPVIVPPEAILADREPFDGISAYVCFGSTGAVRCFVRPGSGG